MYCVMNPTCTNIECASENPLDPWLVMARHGRFLSQLLFLQSRCTDIGKVTEMISISVVGERSDYMCVRSSVLDKYKGT